MWKFILRRKTGKSTDIHGIPPMQRLSCMSCFIHRKTRVKGSPLSEETEYPLCSAAPSLKSFEEFAEEDAMEKLSGIFNNKTLLNHFPGDWKQAREWAKERWTLKCMHAKKRIETAGWEGACHQWLLEVLGYRRNRSPMARISQIYPIETWRSTSFDIEDVYRSQTDWKLKGCRPANHPKNVLSNMISC